MMQTKISFGMDCISDGDAASVMWFLENSFGAECKKKRVSADSSRTVLSYWQKVLHKNWLTA